MHSPSIMFLAVGKSAARAVTSVLWGMRKGGVLRGKSRAEVVCRVMRRRGVMVTAVLCRSVCLPEANAWSCARG